MKQKTTRNICFCIQYVALHFSGHSILEKTRLTTFKGQRSIFSGKHRPQDTTQIASLTAAWLSFMLTESFLFQFFSPPLLSSIHQAASASFYLYFRLLLRDFFSHNPWLKSELVFLLSWWNFVGPYLPTCNSVNFTEILTFLTGSTSLLYPERGAFADLPFLLTSGEPSPTIYISAGTGHQFSTTRLPHQTLQVCHNWAKVLSCQNEIQRWAIPDSYPLWSFDSVSILPLRNLSSQSSKNPPALLTARVEAVSSQAPRLVAVQRWGPQVSQQPHQGSQEQESLHFYRKISFSPSCFLFSFPTLGITGCFFFSLR